MKKTLKLVLLALTCLFISPCLRAQSINQSIIGTWKEDGRGIVGQQDKPGTISSVADSELNNKWTFTKDSVFYHSVIHKKTINKHGKYSIKDSILFVYDDADFKIKKINANELIVVSLHGNKIELLGFPISGVAVRLKRQTKP